jgi:hypothetical protein
LGIVVLVLGCGPDAVITDLKSDRVVVQASGDDKSAIAAEARRGCAMHNKKAEAVTSRCLDNDCDEKEYLFMCKE